MKSKVAVWGNSHAVRVTSAMMDHLSIEPGEEIEIKLTSKGIEIVKNQSIGFAKAVSKEVLDSLISTSEPVKVVDDPYAVTDVGYLVIDINPCKPLIREVTKDTQGSFSTLADAKEAARQVLQSAIGDANKSLAELRQLGIDNISYITL